MSDETNEKNQATDLMKQCVQIVIASHARQIMDVLNTLSPDMQLFVLLYDAKQMHPLVIFNSEVPPMGTMAVTKFLRETAIHLEESAAEAAVQHSPSPTHEAPEGKM